MTACPGSKSIWTGPPRLALCCWCRRAVRVKRDRFVYHVLEERG